MLSITNSTGGSGAYTHHTGEIVGMVYKKIRIANLPPKVLDDTLRAALAPFDQVLDNQMR